MLKVGDKVRIIDDVTGIPVGTRGEVRSFRHDGIDVELIFEGHGIHWFVVENTLDEYFIKEFQPGDRVIFKGTASKWVYHGTLGTVGRLEGQEFTVDWDNGFENDYYGYDPESMSLIERVSEDMTPHTARTPTLPPPPPPPAPTPQRSHGRCYFCSAPDSPWLRDRYTCDACMARFR